MNHTWGCVGLRGVRLCAMRAASAAEIRRREQSVCRGAILSYLPHVAVAEVAEGGGLAVDHAGLRYHAVHDALDEALIHVGTIQIPAGCALTVSG